MAPLEVYVVLHETDGVTTIISAYVSAKDANGAVAAKAGSAKVKTNAQGLALWEGADERCWVEKVAVVPDSSEAGVTSTTGTSGSVAGSVTTTSEGEGDAGKGGTLPRNKSKLYMPDEEDDVIEERDDDGAIFN